ncbi:MAG TPA: hypothetical protein VN985_02915 [Candidatus Eisenbacteria bacterium]|nr:hypothetical protein [Candidatus Eisenbacteria bacterium]
MPPASRILRLLAFSVPAALTLAGVQPILGAATGSVTPGWAVELAGPAIAAALVLYLAARRSDRGDVVQPPWYAAWLLFPGAFLLAGAASMCIFGALVDFPIIAPTMWALVAVGTVAWASAIAAVGRASR